MNWKIGEVSKVEITTICDNYVDALYMDPPGVSVQRRGLGITFNPANAGKTTVADNCSAMLIDLYAFEGNQIGIPPRYRILFDCGGDGDILVQNMKAMDIDPLSINQIVISHGHPDHLGGLLQVMNARNNVPCPVLIHPDTYSSRYIVSPHGFVFPHITAMLPSKKECEDAGARFVEITEPVKVGPGCVTTGNIPWNEDVPFEPSPITLYHEKDNKMVLDETPDEMALAINLKGHGLIVVSGCAHNGIINTVKRCQEVSGVQEVYAVIGGFHLGFPEVPKDAPAMTAAKLKEFNPKVVCPMHCTGFYATAEIMNAMPDAYVQDTLGCRICMPFPKHSK